MPPAPTTAPDSPNGAQSPARTRPGHRRGASSLTIADSPLVQVNAGEPQAFKPKVVAIYESLFATTHHDPGYWVEFFLLPANDAELARVIREASPLAAHEVTMQTLVTAAIANLAGPPQHLPHIDVTINALHILTTVFTTTLALYTQPSAHNATSSPGSIIQLLVGLGRAEALLDDLTSRVWALAYQGPRPAARAAAWFVLRVASAAVGSPLSNLFTTKNYFAAFARVIDQFGEDQAAHSAFTAIGVLAALNQFDDDGANVYQQHIRDFIDEAVMAKMIVLVQRDLYKYTASTRSASPVDRPLSAGIQGWFNRFWTASNEDGSLATELTSKTASNSQDTTNETTKNGAASKQLVKKCPSLLPLYQFVVHNSLFASSFAASPALVALIEANAQAIQTATRTPRQYSHAWLTLLILRHLVETQFGALVDPDAATVIRITSTKLASDTGRRLPLSGVIDALQVGLKSNASKKTTVDWPIYLQLVTVLYQVCAQLVGAHTVLPYYWQQLWQTLFSLSKYISKYAEGPSASQAAYFEEQLLVIVVGMALRRDALDEEDWLALLHRLIRQSQSVFGDLQTAFPQLKRQPAVLAVQAMTQQFELKPEQPDWNVIVRQGVRAAGGHLVSERLPQFSEQRESILKKQIYVQIDEN